MSNSDKIHNRAENGSDAESRVMAIMHAAYQRRASDVHIQPHEDVSRVLFRIDGVLIEQEGLPCELHDRIVSRLKVLARLPVYQHDLPQEGRLTTQIGETTAQARLSTFPTIHGEKAVVRFLGRSDEKPLLLDQLGFEPGIIAQLRRLTDQGSGCLLLTGPAGSGKTTTIYSLLRDIYARRGDCINIITLEDPVEMDLNFAVQSEIRPAAGFTFETGLRSILRQDPEVLMLGEIRDNQTAEMAIEAGLTGHLVISTIHSGNPFEVLTRLLEMKIEPYLVASSVIGVLSQRLLRKPCPDCGKDTADKCRTCFGTGYFGRTAVGQLLTIDEALQQSIMARKSRNELTKDGKHLLVGRMTDSSLPPLIRGDQGGIISEPSPKAAEGAPEIPSEELK